MEQTTNRHYAETFEQSLRVSDPELEVWLYNRAGDGEEARHAA